MNKRGQYNKIFTFIFALIVAALIISFGYYAITNILNLSKEVETVKFKKDLEKKINAYYDFAPGTSAYVELSVPAGIKAVCFVDSGDVKDIKYGDVKEEAEILKGDKNVFFSTVKEDTVAEPFELKKFKPNPDPLCINTLDGVLDIDLVTKGDYVEIREHK